MALVLCRRLIQSWVFTAVGEVFHRVLMLLLLGMLMLLLFIGVFFCTARVKWHFKETDFEGQTTWLAHARIRAINALI